MIKRIMLILLIGIIAVSVLLPNRVMIGVKEIIHEVSFSPNAVIDYTDKVWIREAPTIKAKQIGLLPKNHRIYVVTQREDGWLKIEYIPGKYAYLFSAYCRFDNKKESRIQSKIGVIKHTSYVYDPVTLKRLFRISSDERVLIISQIDDDAIIVAAIGKGVLPSEYLNVIG